MMNFAKIGGDIDVRSVSAQLRLHPELWDEHRWRTDISGGPFSGTSDIWLRYRAIEELKEAKDFWRRASRGVLSCVALTGRGPRYRFFSDARCQSC